MTKFFIIHGAYGNPEENWFPWLKQELEKEGNMVFVPKFPTPENQSLANWIEEFEDFYLNKIDEDSILIGHSLGPAFILSVLDKINLFDNLGLKVKACFFVSGFLNKLGNPTFDKINETFINKDFDWKKIKRNCNKFFVIHSDNDPYIPLKEAKQLADKLDTKVIIIKGAGHFNESSGFKKFDFLLDLIEKEINLKNV
jgi:uncharacterized protein